MQRIVPGKTNQKIAILGKFNINDLIYIAIGGSIVLMTLIFMLVGQVKPFWAILIPVVLEIIIFVFLLAQDKETRIYTFVMYIIRYLIRKKEIPSASLKENFGISFEKDAIKSEIGYSRIINIKGLNFNLINEEAQNVKINQLSHVLSIIKKGKIVKLDTPLHFTTNIEEANKKMEYFEKKYKEYVAAGKEGSFEAYQVAARITSLDNDIKVFEELEETSSIKTNNYFLVLYGNNLNSLNEETNYIVRELNKMGLISYALNEEEIKTFYIHYYSLEGQDKNDLKTYPITEHVNYLDINNNKICITTLCQYPFSLGNAWLSTLTLSNDIKVVINFSKNNDTAKIRKRIDRKIIALGSLLHQKQTESDVIDIQAQIEAYKSLLEEIKFSRESLHIVEIMIISKYDKQVLREIKDAIKNDIGCYLDTLTFRQEEAYANTLLHIPSKEFKDIQRDFQSSTFAGSFPFLSDLFIDDYGNFLGNNNNPVFFDMFYNLNHYGSSGTRTNANIMTIGASGKGKSYLQKILIKDALTSNNKVFILDPENEYSYVAERFGGDVIDVSGGAMRINPLEVFPELNEDKEEKENTKSYGALAKHLSFLSSFFRVVLPDLSNYTRQILQNILKDLYASKKIYNYGYEKSEDKYVSLNELKSKDFPTFNDLIKLIRNKNLANLPEAEAQAYNELKAYMQDFEKDSRFGALWNGPTTISLDNDFIVFNFRGLDAGSSDEVKNGQMLLITKYLMKEIINNFNRNKGVDKKEAKRLVLAIDEAHNFIDPEFPVALDMMKDLAKRIRKYDGSLWVATQNIADFIGFDVNTQTKATAVMNNCQYTFLFGLKPQDLNQVAEMYSKTDVGALTQEEIIFLTEAGQGDVLLLVDSTNRISFHVALKDEEFESQFILPVLNKNKQKESEVN